ncbi:hypothetical protein [Aeromonas aquatica]|uniref:hypothetical protein n=1 Tax=Aeromonas aquatica TaxID=558964 RepID=UPI001376F7FC|nr:hypothetical protein [Aeromonas aquatica]
MINFIKQNAMGLVLVITLAASSVAAVLSDCAKVEAIDRLTTELATLNRLMEC